MEKSESCFVVLKQQNGSNIAVLKQQFDSLSNLQFLGLAK